MAVFTAIGSAIFGAGTFLAGLTAAALQVTAGIAVNLLAKAMQGEPEPPRFGVQGRLQAGEDVPRSINFGWNCTAGSLVYHNTFGSGGTRSVRVIAIGDLPIRDLTRVFVEGKRGTLLKDEAHANFGWPVQQFRKGGKDHLWIKFYDGTQTEADPFLVSTFGTDPDRPYGSDRIGTGIAYAIVFARAPERSDQGNKPLFQGIPNIKFETHGVRWYNIAKDTTAGGDGPQRWDDPATWGGDEYDFNPIVQLYNVKRGIRFDGEWVYGLQSLSPARLPAGNWIAGIEAAQASVEGPDGIERTYRAGGEIQVGAQVATTVEALLTAANARMAEVGGVYKVYAGPSGSPVMAFTDADILSTEEQSFTPFFSLADTVNGVDASYPNPAEGWNVKKAPPRLRPDLEAKDGNRRLMASVSLDLVPYKGQVQRLMKWALAEALRARRHTFVLGPEFRALEPGDVVAWTSARNGYVAKHFRVDGIVYKSNLDVIVDLTEVDPSDYDWDQEADFTPVPDGPIDLVGPRPMPMQGWQVFPATIYDNDNNARRASIEVWFASDVPDVDMVRVQVRLAETSDPMFDGEVPYGEPWKVILAGQFAPQTSYEVRGIFRRSSGSPSEWSEWLPVTTPAVQEVDVTDIQVQQLGRELRNAHGLLTGDSIGAIQTQLAELRALKESIALAALSLDNTVAQQIDITEAHNAASAAAIVESRKALAEVDRALAQLEIELVAIVNESLAGGYMAITAEVNPEESIADILFKVRAIKDGLLSQAAMLLRASVGSGGQTQAIVAMLVDAFYLMRADGSLVDSPFYLEGDAAYIKNAFIKNLTAGNIAANSLDASVIDVGDLFAQNASITGTLRVAPAPSGPGISIQGPNNRILITDNS
ncbi:phage tail protein [Pelagibacterium limicola]|uniref:phage tail protein n=1 Tax=Pelagibacterium limicola TaxID=2791022 RepID=UPI0018AFE6E8|nr:phage tail protein [Pelagibacterium limicola]